MESFTGPIDPNKSAGAQSGDPTCAVTVVVLTEGDFTPGAQLTITELDSTVDSPPTTGVTDDSGRFQTTLCCGEYRFAASSGDLSGVMKATLRDETADVLVVLS
jgi:hypothetical protein